MATDEHEQKQRAICGDKVKIRTKAHAKNARDRLRRTKPTASYYPCPVCKHYHVTSQPTDRSIGKRIAAPDGALVTITYYANIGDSLVVGDGLRTPTGRTYLIVALRMGANQRRYHLRCEVNPVTEPARIFPLVWEPR